MTPQVALLLIAAFVAYALLMQHVLRKARHNEIGIPPTHNVTDDGKEAGK